MDPNIAALLREREHYKRRNLPARVAEVDAVLERLGHNQDMPETAALEPPPETSTPPRPLGRRTNAQQRSSQSAEGRGSVPSVDE